MTNWHPTGTVSGEVQYYHQRERETHTDIKLAAIVSLTFFEWHMGLPTART